MHAASTDAAPAFAHQCFNKTTCDAAVLCQPAVCCRMWRSKRGSGFRSGEHRDRTAQCATRHSRPGVLKQMSGRTGACAIEGTHDLRCRERSTRFATHRMPAPVQCFVYHLLPYPFPASSECAVTGREYVHQVPTSAEDCPLCAGKLWYATCCAAARIHHRCDARHRVAN